MLLDDTMQQLVFNASFHFPYLMLEYFLFVLRCTSVRSEQHGAINLQHDTRRLEQQYNLNTPT